MAKYYNKSQVSLAVTLKGGGSAFLAGKAWTEIPADQESSEDVIQAVRKGFIIRSNIADAVAAPAPAPDAPKTVLSEVKPAETSPPADPPSESSVGEKTSENPRRKKG